MNNQIFGATFAAILVSGLLFFGVANAGAAVVDKWLFPTEEFGNNTYIGTTNVSNMEVASAMAQFSETTETWRQSSELLVTYQDAMASYPLDDAEILLDETAQQAQSGVQNSFVYALQENTTKRFLNENFSGVEFSSAEVEKLTIKLEEALQSGLEQTHVIISDDSLTVDRETVSEVVFPRASFSEGASALVDAIDEVQIAPGERFSLLNFMNEGNFIGVTDNELTEIASAIYSAVLQTNFKIEERSIGTKVPNEVPVGQEAAINRTLGIDLVFSNPNASSFTLNTAFEGDSLTASFIGFPFVYEYVVLKGEEAVKPRLVKQYSAFVASGSAVDEAGSEGVRVEMIRSVLSEGEELELETISTDFYPPTNRVEVHPLIAPPVEEVPVTDPDEVTEGAEEEQTSENDEAATDSMSGNTEADPGTTEDQNSAGGSISADSPDGSTNGGSGAENNVTDQETDSSSAPNSNKDSGSEQPVYDKGGNLVNP